MRQILFTLLLVVSVALIAGCARFPTTFVPPDAPPRTIYSSITVRGQINDQDYYFLALGVDQSQLTGPVPVVTGPELTNGWGTISPLPSGQVEQPPFFVEYHNGRFEQFRQEGTTAVSLGLPFDFGISSDRKQMWVEIDQRLLSPLLGSATSPVVQLNWMTMQEIVVPPEEVGLGKQYDGFGHSGNDYISNLPLLTPITRTSGVDGVPDEYPYGEPGTNPEVTAQDPDIDMVQWQVAIHIQQTTTGAKK